MNNFKMSKFTFATESISLAPWFFQNNELQITDAYSEPSQASKITKIV